MTKIIMVKYEEKMEAGFGEYPDATHVCINPYDIDDWDFCNDTELIEVYRNTKPYVVISREEFEGRKNIKESIAEQIEITELLIKKTIKNSIFGEVVDPDYLMLQSLLNERMQLIHESVYGKRMLCRWFSEDDPRWMSR